MRWVTKYWDHKEQENEKCPIRQRINLQCFYTILLAHHRSKWFKRINFVATQYSSYLNERSKNFTHSECEEHFYPKDSLSSTDVDNTIEALKFIDIGGLLSICALMVVPHAWVALTFHSRKAAFTYWLFKEMTISLRTLGIPCSKIVFLNKCDGDTNKTQKEKYHRC